MNLNETPPDQPHMWYDPNQGYIQRLVDTFCLCLSPQELPHNMAAKLLMDDELWMPIRVLAKLPRLDSLFLSDIMFPFVTQTLYEYANHYLEVDVARELVRPRWALRSSVFISNVDMYATADQIYGLLDDLRSSMMYPNNPYEFDNISISKQTANAWSISFKSPSAGPYAAMSMKSKCINGALVLPMACVHINPPGSVYSNMDVVVMEVDALQYGNPVVPVGYLQYYSENPAHMNLLYNVSMINQEVPTYQEPFTGQGAVPFMPPPIKERSCSNQSLYTQPSVEKGNEIDSDSLLQAPPETPDQSEHDHHLTGELEVPSTQGDTESVDGVPSINQNAANSALSDKGAAKQEKRLSTKPKEGSPAKASQPTEEFSNPTPPEEESPDTSRKVPDRIEPKGVVKTGEQTAALKLLAHSEPKLSTPSSAEVGTRDNTILRSSKCAEEDWIDYEGTCSIISFPEPESLHKPSFAKLVQLEALSSKERSEEEKQNQVTSAQKNRSTRMNISSNTNPVPSDDPHGLEAAPQERKEFQVNKNREHSGERQNGKGRNRHSPQSRRRHPRKGSGGFPGGELDLDYSNNFPGSRRRNGQNRKSRNKGQRFNGENQQRNSNHNGESCSHREDWSHRMNAEVAVDIYLPSGQRNGLRDEDWQTISYKRLGARRSQRCYSTLEGNSRNRAGQQANSRDRRLRSSSSHSHS